MRRSRVRTDSLEIDPIEAGLALGRRLDGRSRRRSRGSAGELLLDLVEGGQHFTCTIDLDNRRGDALGGGHRPTYAPTAKTSIDGPGEYRVAFANVDDQLLLWVDGDLVAFEGGTAYDVDARSSAIAADIMPQTSDDDPGDLAPAGIGARDAKLAVTRLQVWRDIYYIADSWERTSRWRSGDRFRSPVRPISCCNLPYEPVAVGSFRGTPARRFPARRGPVLCDGRQQRRKLRRAAVVRRPRARRQDRAAQYLERRLLIGKALCVYWPHSWNRIPGTPIPFPLFPNFEDMRLVR